MKRRTAREASVRTDAVYCQNSQGSAETHKVLPIYINEKEKKQTSELMVHIIFPNDFSTPFYVSMCKGSTMATNRDSFKYRCRASH